MDIARINMAHVKTQEESEKLYNVLRTAFKNKGKECPICVDLCGPNIRLINFPDNKPIELKAGDEIYITFNRHVDTSNNIFFCDYNKLPYFLSQGDKIIMDDGKISFKVKKLEKELDILESIGLSTPVKMYKVF